MKPRITTVIVNGELQHVLTVGGRPFQSFATLKAALCAMALAISLAGCATCREHPIACGIGGSVLITSIALSTNSGHHHNGPDVTVQPVTCVPAESCR